MAYATLTDLTNWLGGSAPPGNGSTLLDQASNTVDDALIGARYNVDAVTTLPVDAPIIAALRDATCAQVEWWVATQDELEQFRDFHSIGAADQGTNLQRTPGRRDPLAPRASSVLRRAQLLPVKPVV